MLFLAATVTVDTRALREFIDLVCAAAGLSSLDKLAAAIEVDRTQLQRQMDGDGHVSLSRIVTTLGNSRFYSELGWQLTLKYGPTIKARRSAWLYFGYLWEYHIRRIGK